MSYVVERGWRTRPFTEWVGGWHSKRAEGFPS